MTKEFIPYQQALDLKELGFDERCVAYYTADTKQLTLVQGYSNLMFADYVHLANTVKSVPCPLYQQAFRWLLDKHYLYGIVIPTVTMDWTFKTMTAVYGMVEVPPYNHVDAYDYSSKEEAELACLIKLIEIVKDGKSKSNS